MRAAVVTAFDTPPRGAEHPEPVATGPDELVVDVLAAGLHPRVRSQADGSHYTSTGALPLVPGIDAVVRGPDGELRYAILGDGPLGTMAERTVIEAGRSIVLPPTADPVTVAAAMNPAMSSWVALRRRIDFPVGGSVLVIGASGSAERMAVQVARRFGASRVIAAGRDRDRLASVGADEVATLDDLAGAADVDVVLDYVWGPTVGPAMVAMLTGRTDRSRPLSWVEIGSVGGADAVIPSAALRSARLQIVGSGIGSVPGRDFVVELPSIAAAISEGAFDVRARAVPLAEVSSAWAESGTTSDRLVVVP